MWSVSLAKLALDNVMKQELEQRSSSGHYKWGRQLPGEWENWWVQSVGGEQEENFPQEHISNYLFMNWWTGGPPIETSV